IAVAPPPAPTPAPAPEPPAAVPPPTPPPAPRKTHAPKPVAAAPEEPPEGPELSDQLTAYRHALAQRGKDDARALDEWRQIKQKWPTSHLNHEIDLNVIDTLIRLGRTAEAKAAAQDFLRIYPNSPRRAEIERIAKP